MAFLASDVFSVFLFACKAVCLSFLCSLAFGTARLILARNAPVPHSLATAELARLRKGDILVFGKRSVVARGLIQLATVLTRPLRDRCWVHAAVYAGNGIVWESRAGGVTAAPLAEHLTSATPVRVLRHRYVGGQALDRVIDFCAARRGRPYAFRSVYYLAFVNLLPLSFRSLVASERLDRIFRDDERFSCAELIVEAYASADHRITPSAGWRVTAADLLDSPVLFDPFRPAAASASENRGASPRWAA